MDTYDYPSLGWLAVLNAQLAVQNRQVAATVDGQLDELERLFRAAAEGDWQAILRASEELTAQSKDRVDKAVVQTARRVCDALHRDPTGAKASQNLSELLAACREWKRRRERP